MRFRLFRRLAASLLILTLAAVFLAGQQCRIQTEEIAVLDSRIPAGFDGFRIVQITDLHGGVWGDGDNKRLLAAVSAARPDLIVLVGDIVDEHSDLNTLGPLAGALAALAPTYYVTGNHEWATKQVNGIKTTLRSHGVTVLENDVVPLERNGSVVCLMGVDDPNGPHRTQETLPQMMTEARAGWGDPYTILLAHRNDEYEVSAQFQVDLTLSGHAHGGLIRLPFTDGLISTRRTLFPDHTAGLYPLEYGQLMVSRGLGNIPPMFRLFNRPHLPVLVLRTP